VYAFLRRSTEPTCSVKNGWRGRLAKVVRNVFVYHWGDLPEKIAACASPPFETTINGRYQDLLKAYRELFGDARSMHLWNEETDKAAAVLEQEGKRVPRALARLS
jgi:hypothetical protein